MVQKYHVQEFTFGAQKHLLVMLSLIHGENEFWNKNSKSLLSLIYEKSDF